VVSVNLVRLSSKKAAYVVVDESGVVGNPESARDDKVEGSAHLGSCYGGMEGAAGYLRFSNSICGDSAMRSWGTRPVPSGSSCDTGSLGTEHLSNRVLYAAWLEAQVLFDA
jgi:hypothetical protein